MSQAEIRLFQEKDILKVKKLTDREIGQDYYSVTELEKAYARSIKDGVNCSFVLEENEMIVGIRLTYPPGQWQRGKGSGLTVHQWPFSLDETAYFQSLFMSQSWQNRGWGKALSMASIDQLKKLRTSGVVCHSWKESPHNSSQKYLLSMGFRLIKEHPKYWYLVDYTCPRCGKPCECTAQEMYLNLQES